MQFYFASQLNARNLDVSAEIDSITINNPTCGLDNGRIIIHASGAPNIRYSVDGGTTFQGDSVFGGLIATDYLIFIISGTTCSDVTSVTLLIDNFPALPDMDCPSNFTIDCADDPINTLSDAIEFVSSLNFNGEPIEVTPTLPLTDIDFSLCNQTQMLELMSIDTCMGMSTCIVDLLVLDNDPPVVSCPDPFDVFIADTDHLDRVNDWENQFTGVDPCGSDVTFLSDLDTTRLNFLCDSFFVIPVEFTGTDNCGNMASCLSQLNVTNELDPVVTCLPTFEILCNSDPEEVLDDLLVQFEQDPAFDEDVSIEDGSNIEDIIGLTCGDTLTIDFGVVDGCFRTTDCSTLVTIFDTIPPTQDACPVDLIISEITSTTADEISMWLDSGPDAIDNCSQIDNSTNFDTALFDDLCAWPGTVTVQFISADRCGNRTTCESNVSLPNTSISLTCQDNLVLECGAPNQEQLLDDWLLLATAFDVDGQNRDIENSFSGIPSDALCVDTLAITFIVLNDCGQASSCEAMIYIQDTTTPTLTCPDNQSFNLSSEDISTELDLWLTSYESSDLCSTPMVTNDLNFDVAGIDCSLDTTVVFTSIDSCGLSSTCSTSLLISNDLQVQINCPADTVILCTGLDVNEILESAIESTSIIGIGVNLSDNLQELDLNNDCSETQNLTVSLTAEDACSNEDFCSFEVTLRPEASVYIPTIFDLSAQDETNRSFQIFGDASVRMIELRIYDRWGKPVHIVSDENNPTNVAVWDGRINGTSAEQGVYTYVLRYIEVGGTTTDAVGHFTLIK